MVTEHVADAAASQTEMSGEEGLDAGTQPPLVEPVTDWRRRHLLDVDVLSKEEIMRVLSTANAMAEVLERKVARTPTLRGVTIFNLFYEASTRTRSSFELAGKILGADVINVSGSGSSVEKGESLVETLNTLSAVGADAVVMRHQASGAPWLAARTIDGHIIKRRRRPTRASDAGVARCVRADEGNSATCQVARW